MLLGGINWSQKRLSGIDIKVDRAEKNVTLTVQDRKNSREARYVVTMPIDRAMAEAIVEAQNNRTHRGERVVGGWGVTGQEMKELFERAQDACGPGCTPSGSAVMLQALDIARDDRFDVRINNVKIRPAGFGGLGGDARTFGAEQQFNVDSKPQRDGLWQRNVLGVPRPIDDP